jgi:DNA-binding CsgD family transcriptional regulator
MAAASFVASTESYRDMTEGAEVLDSLQKQFRSLGAHHLLVTGIPMPGRPIEPLVLRAAWGDARPGGAPAIVTSDDPLLRLAQRKRRGFVWSGPDDEPADLASPLLAAVGASGERQVIGIPISAFQPYQAVVLAAGRSLLVDGRTLFSVEQACVAAFERLFELAYLRPERPGELSARERAVVELSASGKTAAEIADILVISQRTVHAHLQNASEKLAATNKTSTVVAALLYGQIEI